MRPAFPVSLVLAAVALACAAPGIAPPGPARDTASVPLPPDGEVPPVLQLPPDVRPVRCALALEIDPSKDAFHGAATIEIALKRPRRAIWLHGRGLRVSAATVSPAQGGSVAAGYGQVNEDGLARLDLAAPVGPGSATIRIAWEAGFGDGYGLFRARAGGDAYAATQLEAHDARRVFPGFDEPRFKTPFDVSIVVPERRGGDLERPGRRLGADRRRRSPRPFRHHEAAPDVSPLLRRRAVRGGDRPADPAERGPAGADPRARIRAARARRRARARPAVHGRDAPLAGAVVRDRLSLRQARLDCGARAWPPRNGERGRDRLRGADRPPPGRAGGDAATACCRWAHRPRAGPPVVRRPGDAPVVDGRLAQRVVRHVDDLPDARRMASGVAAVARPVARNLRRGRAARAPGPGWRRRLDDAGRCAPDRARHPQAAGPDVGRRRAVRRGELLQGRGRARDVRALGRAGDLPRGRARLPRRHAHGTGTTPELLEALSRAAGRDVAGAMETFLERPGVPLVEARAACGPEGNAVRLAQAATTVRGAPAAPRAPWRIPVCVRYRVAGAEREGCTLLGSQEGALAIPEGCPEWIFPNAGGAGYYRSALAPADLDRLRRGGLARLDVMEKAALAGSVRAAQRAGRLSYGEAMEVLAELGRDPHPAVAPLPMPAVAHAHRDLVPAAARPAVEAFARALYRPALDRLGWVPRSGESFEDRRYRAELVRLLVRTARDPAATREAARRGAAYLGVAGGALGTAAVDPDLAEDAVAAAIAEGGAPALEVAAARALSTSDGGARERILTGIGFAGRPELVPRVFEVARDPRLVAVERVFPIEGAFKHPATRQAALDELERTAGELVRVLPPFPRRFLLGAVAWQCDARAADRIKAIFEPRFEAMPDLRLPVADAVERIRACAAEREADGEAAARWFAARATTAPPVGR